MILKIFALKIKKLRLENGTRVLVHSAFEILSNVINGI